MRAATMRSRENTRTRLVSAAEALLAETGTARLSIDEICERAGFTHGAFYSNFGAVDDVLFALYERKTAEVLEGIAAARPRMRPGARVDDVADGILEVVQADADWFTLRVTFAASARSDAAMAASLREHGEQLVRGVAPGLARLVEDAGLALRLDEYEAARVVVAAHVGAVLQAAFVDDPPLLRRDTVRAALRGITEPGAAVAAGGTEES